VPPIRTTARMAAATTGQMGLLLRTSTSTASTWPSGWMISGQEAPSGSTAVALMGRPSCAARAVTSAIAAWRGSWSLIGWLRPAILTSALWSSYRRIVTFGQDGTPFSATLSPHPSHWTPRSSLIARPVLLEAVPPTSDGRLTPTAGRNILACGRVKRVQSGQ
jgi:hypothetical protein